MPTPLEIGELAIWAALEEHQGHLLGAARALGLSCSSLQKALDGWAKHLGDAAAALRKESGYTFGRPGLAEHQVDRDEFLRTWAAMDRSIRGIARELGLDCFAVQRLARLYRAPGAPPPRKRR